MRRLVLLLAAVAALTALASAPATAGFGGQKTWSVTIENLTSGQPLSPPLLVVHSNRVDVWSVGDIATHPIAAIGEDANNAPAESALSALGGVLSATTAGGPIPPGQSATYEIVTRGAFRQLSLVTMLVNTNDAFTGLDSLALGARRVRVLETMAYDAGSEINNELATRIPGPCCNNPFVRDPEGALIQMHPGIAGTGDLDPSVYGWTGPVARITIERAS